MDHFRSFLFDEPSSRPAAAKTRLHLSRQFCVIRPWRWRGDHCRLPGSPRPAATADNLETASGAAGRAGLNVLSALTILAALAPYCPCCSRPLANPTLADQAVTRHGVKSMRCGQKLGFAVTIVISRPAGSGFDLLTVTKKVRNPLTISLPARAAASILEMTIW